VFPKGRTKITLPSAPITGGYGVLGSSIFCLVGLFASISARLASSHLTRPLNKIIKIDVSLHDSYLNQRILKSNLSTKV
jgi:hypothetical protein